jgi:FKBP-type peptidyl-prolyl cis-trans isomerase FkpA
MISRTSRVATGLLACVALLASSCSKQPTTGPTVIDPDAPQEFTTTDSGLKYRILRKSSGPKPSANDRVTVDYSGWLDDQTIFDSSYERRQPTTFGLSGVIAGWTEGLQLVGVGGMIELEIPSQLGYGEAGSLPDIPPNVTLHFKVELHEIY